MNEILKHIILFFVFLVFQINLFDHLALFGVAIPFVFLLFVFMLPLSLPMPALYVITFIVGFSVDIFSDSYANGLHTFSALLAVSLRPQVISLTGVSSFRSLSEVSLSNQSFAWYMIYLLPLIAIHHLAYFYLEAFTFQNFFSTFLKVLGSLIYTFLLSYVICIIFYKR